MAAQPPPGEAHDPIRPRPVKVDMVHIIAAGMGVWVIALVVALVVPAFHSGERDWWPWVPVISLALGAFGIWYIRRGRGNASAA